MKIEITNVHDIPEIFRLYDDATALQQQIGNNSWKGFKSVLIEQEITEQRHYKITEENQIACTFLVAFKNPVLWKDEGNDGAIYLHRIATNSNFRGRSYMTKIVNWAINYAKENNLQFIRLDTGSGNDNINKYYERCGFTYNGIQEINWTPDLPEHYKDGSFSLFEMKV